MDKCDSNKIGLWTAVFIGLNAMIGIGVIAMPAMLARGVGPACVFTFIISILTILSIGITLGEAAEKFPGPGWSYLYTSSWAGHQIGLLSTLSYYFGLTAAMGLLVRYAGIYAHKLLPVIPANLLGYIILVTLTITILAGAKVSSWGQYIIVFCVVTPIISTIAICLLNFRVELLDPFFPQGPLSIFKALPITVFGIIGFESISSLYASIRRPKRNVPLALMISIISVAAIYLLFSFSILTSVPHELFTAYIGETLAKVLQMAFPKYQFVSLLVIVSATFGIIGTLHSIIWSSSTLLFSMAKKVKSQFVREGIKKNYISFYTSTVLTFSIILISSFFLVDNVIVDITVLLIVQTYLLSCISLLFLLDRWKSKRNILTCLSVLSCCLLVYIAIYEIFETLMG